MKFYIKFMNKVQVADRVRIGVKDSKGMATRFTGQVAYIDREALKVVVDWDGIRIIAPLEQVFEFVILESVEQ